MPIFISAIAFPFEESGIAVHEKNVELLRAEVYNPWIARSLAELATLVPGRYARQELSTGLIGSSERWAYVSPAAQAAEAALAAAAAESLAAPEEPVPTAQDEYPEEGFAQPFDEPIHMEEVQDAGTL